MDSYCILKNIHKVVHLITGTVLGSDKTETNGFISCSTELETETDFKALITSIAQAKELNKELTLEKGYVVEAVIKNHVGNTLYLSIAPEDLQAVGQYKAFYDFIEKLKEGQIVTGIVQKVVPFGIFVDLSYPYPGLIDIGHSGFNGGQALPANFTTTIHEGDAIKCIITYFRFANRQIGLGWLPG